MKKTVEVRRQVTKLVPLTPEEMEAAGLGPSQKSASDLPCYLVSSFLGAFTQVLDDCFIHFFICGELAPHQSIGMEGVQWVNSWRKA